MTPAQVHDLLAQHRDERGVQHHRRRHSDSSLECLGIGLTVLRKLGKQIGRDAALAASLWQSPVYEARVVSLLIDDPKAITRAQAERQVEQVRDGQLMHVFSSCDAALAKVPFARQLAEDWMQHADTVRQQCGYGLLYELSKTKGRSAPDDDWFSRWVQHMDEQRHGADVDVLLAMAGALLGVGKRSPRLNAEALAVARAIGPVDWDRTGDCEPFDVVKHLDNPRLRAVLGLGG